MSSGPIERATELARTGRLYPALILHGGSDDERRRAASDLGRTLLCEREPAQRPCGSCRHCRRIVPPPLPADSKRDDDGPFHPDFLVLERDLKTATSVEKTRELVRSAQLSPYEARGQVFVVTAADTLSGEAGDALLKLLEEPGLGAPRHFLLLAGSRLDLPATLRSRSMALYLGAPEPLDAEKVEATVAGFSAAVQRFAARRNPLFLLEAAATLARAGDFEDLRSEAGWVLAATVVRVAAMENEALAGVRAPLLDLAAELLGEAPRLRLRGIPADRILEGMVSQGLAG